uniref:Uncharacterized protein n=1 Tax=Bracon brevicornis TaxID=1563983 RepID=A0A6V7M3V5_9HYME
MKKSQTENSELKALLKMQQYEGLSLSEILQQRNLSLSDLLKGKTEVISALREPVANPEDDKNAIIITTTTDDKIVTVTTPPSVTIAPDAVDNYPVRIVELPPQVFSAPKVTSKSVMIGITSKSAPTTTPRSAGINTESDDITSNSVILQYTTPKSVTTTAESVETTSEVERTTTNRFLNDDDEIMEFSDFKRRKTDENPLTAASNIEKFHRDMESILNIRNIQRVFTTTEGTVEQTTQDEQRVNSLVKEGEFNYDDLDLEYQNEEPTSVVSEESPVGPGGEMMTTGSPVNHRPNSKIYEEIFSEIEPEARAEILELLNSSATAEKLEDLLRSRNMSLEELIALRQRGSSRLHLAQVKSAKMQNKVRSDGVMGINETKSDSSEEHKMADGNSENRPIFNKMADHNLKHRPISRHFDEAGGGEDKGPIIIDLTPNKFEENGGKQADLRDSDELIDLLREFDSLPFAIIKKSGDSSEVIKSADKVVENYHDEVKSWQNPATSPIAPIFEEIGKQSGGKHWKFDETNEDYGKSYENNGKSEEIGKFGDEDELIEKLTKIHKNVETSTKQSSFGINNVTNDEEVKTLSKVKPSIIASGTILGITIIGFLLILIILKIRQKQRYTYGNAFPRTVFQVPVMNTRKLSSSSSNTIMVNVVATSTVRKQGKREMEETHNDIYDYKSDMENDSLDANDSWDTIPDFMK